MADVGLDDACGELVAVMTVNFQPRQLDDTRTGSPRVSVTNTEVAVSATEISGRKTRSHATHKIAAKYLVQAESL